MSENQVAAIVFGSWGAIALLVLIVSVAMAGAGRWDGEIATAVAAVGLFLPLALVGAGTIGPFVGVYHLAQWWVARPSKPLKPTVVNVGDGPFRTARVCSTCGQSAPARSDEAI